MRIDPDTFFESRLWRAGLLHVAGLDEAGRGALAGPVAVGAVILPEKRRLSRTLAGVRDSKQMTPLEREALAPRIQEIALAWSVGFAAAEEIDSLGIVNATRLAALRALGELSIRPHYLLTDFRLDLPELDLPQTALVKGDTRCLSIAAASVLAKTARDRLMCELDVCYQGYGLGQHKGYGTQAHRSALERLGVSPVHRRSFQVKEVRVT
jgi:ribonuclease HII